jgi:hypothetical protein
LPTAKTAATSTSAPPAIATASSLAVIGTNADESACASPANGKLLGKSAPLLSVAAAF